MMPRAPRATLSLVLAAAWATSPALLTAQTCLGAPQLAGRFANLEGSAAFYSGARGLGLGLTLGSSLFLEIDYTREHYDEHAQPQDTFVLGMGYEFMADSGDIAVCPTASYGLSSGIYEFRTRHADAGIALGFRTNISESARLVPFGEIAATWSRTHFGCFFCTEPEPDWAGLLVLGARLETSPTLSFGPSVRMPFADDEGEARFGTGVDISVTVGL